MSFLRAALVVACFGAMLSGVSAAFSAQISQANAGGQSLVYGANQPTATTGASWTTSGLGGFTDGQFQADGGYIVPVGGVYHFDATLQIEVTKPNVTPDQTVDLRIVKCSNGCNTLCAGSGVIAATLVQGGTLYISDSFSSAFPPTFSISASFTGQFNTGDLIALCVDSNASSGDISLVCGPNQCTFSGYTV